ncbi:hypothetical protein EVAR_7978_1 [Eumeta japonica]|uniref:Uncharacterized protein n=1 Tax=Eumeta variegata TaxID=151549 RepID=A0A4C1THZ4_EUMVA|nr:hypothetical protein EVAR_7978_1 [Eumeta japonica]
MDGPLVTDVYGEIETSSIACGRRARVTLQKQATRESDNHTRYGNILRKRAQDNDQLGEERAAGNVPGDGPQRRSAPRVAVIERHIIAISTT